jgi:uncharacterized membrane protein YkoI
VAHGTVVRTPNQEATLMHKKITAGVAGLAALAVTAGAALAAGGGTAASTGHAGSRLDDGRELLGQATITERQAITAAQGAAAGALDEVDLEHRAGRLVFNVDVGRHDVKVDAKTGDVVAVDQDD